MQLGAAGPVPVTSERFNATRCKGVALRIGASAPVEFLSHRIVVMGLVHEGLELEPRFFVAGHALHGCVIWSGQVHLERVGLAATQAQADGCPVSLAGQGRILDEQGQKALAVDVACRRSVPDPSEVARQFHDPFVLLGGYGPLMGLAEPFALGDDARERLEAGVPFGLASSGDEAV